MLRFSVTVTYNGKTHGVVKCSVRYFVQLLLFVGGFIIILLKCSTNLAIIDFEFLESYEITFGVKRLMFHGKTSWNFMFIFINNKNVTTPYVFPCVVGCARSRKDTSVDTTNVGTKHIPRTLS